MWKYLPEGILSCFKRKCGLAPILLRFPTASYAGIRTPTFLEPPRTANLFSHFHYPIHCPSFRDLCKGRFREKRSHGKKTFVGRFFHAVSLGLTVIIAGMVSNPPYETVTRDKENDINFPINRVAVKLGFRITRGCCILCFSCAEHRTTLKLDPVNNSWQCSVCRSAGSTVELVMQVLKLSREGAKDWLVKTIRIRKRRTLKPAGSAKKRRKKNAPGLHVRSMQVTSAIHNISDPEIYQFILDQSPLLPSGKNYLGSRGFSEATCRQLKIAQLDHPERLLAELFTRWPIDALRKAGIIQIEEDTELEELIWPAKTILFPFFDQKNKLIYVQGRALIADKRDRYINLSGIPTPLYNLGLLRHLNPGDTIHFFEGVTDCISGIQEGLNGFGVLGAYNFKPEWANLFKPYEIHLIPDNDYAGSHLVEAITSAFAKIGKQIRVQHLPYGKDYNEFIAQRNYQRTQHSVDTNGNITAKPNGP